MKHIYAFLFILICQTAFSQTDSVPLNQLKEVIISPFHINDSLMNAPASIGILSEKDLKRNNGTDISTAINSVSGILMQSGALNTNRISIRGIGARTPYGTNKIRAFYGNIPLTSGDSETTIEDLNIENIEQVEIIKGPLSSLYGAGLGGAILLTPKLENFGNKTGISTTYGSFGLVKSNADVSANSKTAGININYHKIESDGWRQNSSYKREGVTISGELFRKANSKLTYLANYTYLKSFVPSSIDKETFDNNPKAAAVTWLASKGFEQYDSYLAGLNYDFRLGKVRNSTSVFLNSKISDEPRPFDILKQNTNAYGARTQFSGDLQLLKIKSDFIIGAEYFRDGFKGNTFENLYEDNNGEGSLQGNQLTGTKQKRHFYNAFAQLRIIPAKKFELQAGLNVNKTGFELDNTFPLANASSEDYSYDAIWSPQVSLLFKPNAMQTIYISASRGFSLPSVEETLTANGTINSDIKPESGYNYELGGKFYFLNKQLYTEIAIYRMQIKDLLVARRVGDDQYVGVNAGKTLHQGVEFSMNYNTKIGRIISISTFASASFGEYKFEEFNDNDNDFSGNELTGVPDSKANAGITLRRSGFYLSGDFQFVDKLPMDDANSVYSDAYRIVNLKTGYRFDIFQHFTSHISAGINNAANEHYASMVLVNAVGSGGNAPRFYYPGLPVNYYANMAFSYTF
jgi:iron complex outermembrane receptor protein